MMIGSIYKEGRRDQNVPQFSDKRMLLYCLGERTSTTPPALIYVGRRIFGQHHHLSLPLLRENRATDWISLLLDVLPYCPNRSDLGTIAAVSVASRASGETSVTARRPTPIHTTHEPTGEWGWKIVNNWKRAVGVYGFRPQTYRASSWAMRCRVVRLRPEKLWLFAASWLTWHGGNHLTLMAVTPLNFRALGTGPIPL